MNEITHIYLMDMTYAGNTSGVDRYMEELIQALKSCKNIHLYRIQLRYDKNLIFHQEECTNGVTEITIPIPQQKQEIIRERYWLRKYNIQVFRLIHHLFIGKNRCLLHLHTVNLIDLALLIREQVPCRIVSHLHCIPWKSYYNSDLIRFNQLYELANGKKDEDCQPEKFLSNNCEWQYYTEADKVICVTHCAAHFLQQIMQIPESRIAIIPNGMQDFTTSTVLQNYSKKPHKFALLYVGFISQSKGLDFILTALRKVKDLGYDVQLKVAGYMPPQSWKTYQQKVKELNVHFLGRITFNELQEHYKQSDAGIIASLQEQCSYVAIEMCMFGLPIITTAVDGLDEMFTDGIDALKVGVHFSKPTGLQVDTDSMAKQIIRLIEDKAFRKELGIRARQLYTKHFTQIRMLQQTISLYKEITNCITIKKTCYENFEAKRFG